MKLLFILLGLCVCPILMAQQTEEIQEAMANYEYEKVISLIEQEEPTAQLLFMKARAQKGLFRYEDAIKSLKTAVNEQPENLQFIIELAECNRAEGKFKDALQCYEQVLALNPENKYVRLQQINLLNMMENYTEAGKICGLLLANDSSAIALRLMAQCYEGQMKQDSAMVYYNKVITKKPADYLSVAKLASMHIKNEAPEMTIAITENYRKIDSTNLYVNRQNAQAYCLNKDYDSAIERYNYLINQGDSSMLTCYYLGMSYFAKEQFYEAHDFLETAHKYDPKNVNILYYLGRSCAKTSWKKQGIEYLQQALDLTIPTGEALAKLYEGLGDCYFMAGDYHKQLAAVKEQYKQQPKNNLLYRMAYIYQDLLKDNKNAEKYLVMYLNTKEEEDAPEPEEEAKMEGMTLVLGESSLYRAAERRLEDIRKENFFKEGIKE